MTTSIIRFLNIILAALLAGVSFGIWIGFNPLKVSPSTYIEQQQNMIGVEKTDGLNEELLEINNNIKTQVAAL